LEFREIYKLFWGYRSTSKASCKQSLSVVNDDNISFDDDDNDDHNNNYNDYIGDDNDDGSDDEVDCYALKKLDCDYYSYILYMSIEYKVTEESKRFENIWWKWYDEMV